MSDCECRTDKTSKINKYILLGFKGKSASSLTYIDAITYPSSDRDNCERILLNIAEENEAKYSSMKILALDDKLRTIYCKDICFAVPVKLRAKLC